VRIGAHTTFNLVQGCSTPSDKIQFFSEELAPSRTDKLFLLGRNIADKFFLQNQGLKYSDFVAFASKVLGDKTPLLEKYFSSWYNAATTAVKASRLDDVDSSEIVSHSVNKNKEKDS
jgi:hypothetical protein